MTHDCDLFCLECGWRGMDDEVLSEGEFDRFSGRKCPECGSNELQSPEDYEDGESDESDD